MWRRRLTWAGATYLALELLLPSRAAQAGALAQVVGGLNHAAGDDGKHDDHHGSGNDDDHDSSSSSSSSSSDTGGGGGYSCCSIPYDSTLGYAYASTPANGEVVTEVYVGAQSVHDSDGSLTAEARATFDGFGLGARETSFFERQHTLDPETVHLDVWWLGALWRVDHGEKFNVWLEAGFTGLSDQAGLTMSGVGAGLHLWRHLGGAMAVVGAARASWFQHDVHSTELFAGVQVTYLQFGWRVVDFDVGPPLYGPEFGLNVVF
jgi:hypothetical protein